MAAAETPLGPAAALDPRVNAFRSDLADVSLQHIVTAERYVEPVLRQCVRGILPVLSAPKPEAQQTSQVRYGEFLDVFEQREDGFAWAQNRNDRYVGYIPFDHALSDSVATLSYRVSALRTFIYPEPNIKAPPIDELTLGSFVGIVEARQNFWELANGGFVIASHIAPAAETKVADYAFTAGRLLHTPYLWGGRTPKGIDCSGLVQLALELADIECPRDSDQQRAALGQPLPCHWRDMDWRRGDIVFFEPTHVGIMADGEHMIHATEMFMLVTSEALADVVRTRKVDVIAYGRF
jgi:cell wall-associated NlpC family hydrolase